ncbi:cytochrome c oxidase subunit 3 [Salmonirosea aquatica]|uniref:Heme-copper oxidase subunit III n=1 Tax=Salmonirosea aquatica TaxID=2654236 RepID=A0A7C9BFC2_9BACT|nr:heme-copper oxidase subunit III [Cytophagaceae bacterium SJW1-29]
MKNKHPNPLGADRADRLAVASQQYVPIRRELPERARRQYELLIKFFVASESFFFMALIISYLYYRGVNQMIDMTDQVLNAQSTGMFTALLVLSSGTLWWGRHHLERQKPVRLAWGLAATIALGAVFLYGQGLEYAHLLRENVTVDRNIFGSAFFTLTGFHALHVFVGLILLSIVLILTLLGDFTGPRSAAVAATELYWHFVDVVWLIVFTVVYLI